MNLDATRVVSLLSLILFAACHQIIAQDDLGDFLLAHPDDAEKLATDYISPLVKGFGFAANNGWYNTARPHTMGFDLTVTATASFIPSKDKLNQFIETQFNDLELLSPVDNMVPTVFGPEDISPRYRVKSTGEEFEGPPGNSLEEEYGFDAILFPMIQLGVGVIPNTDVKIRFMPRLEFDEDFEAKMWGIGVLHHLNNYFPSGDELLIDISLFGGFTQVETEIQVHDTYPGENQIGAQIFNSWTVEALLSYDLSVFTFYGGVGYNEVISDLDVLGTYDVGNEILVDPISASVTYGGPKATFGIRIKLAVIAIHGEYTFNQYQLVTAGFGININ